MSIASDTPKGRIPVRPRAVKAGEWTLPALQHHLQYAIDLELWTVPFYMAAMYSIRDASTEASELLRSIMNQEMLHMQLAANVANAFGCDVVIAPPVYGKGVPHVDFAFDEPDPRTFFHPSSSEIGPLDVARVNAMCLIEYPDSTKDVDKNPDDSEYGSIGAFYRAVKRGVTELADTICGNRHQVNLFAHLYPQLPGTVTGRGAEGLPQVLRLLDAIMSQGEGSLKFEGLDAGHEALAAPIEAPNRNLADDPRPAATHFEKFVYLRKQPLPATWAVGFTTPAGTAAQERLKANFAQFCAELQTLFRGGSPEAFGPLMFTIGGNIRVCWQNGATPTFSEVPLNDS